MTKKPNFTLVGSAATGTPPRQLRQPGASLWAAVLDQYDIADAGGVETLMQICEAADRVEEIGRQISEEGLTIRTKSGPKEHPLLKIELGLRSFITRNLQRLGINVEPLKSPGRPGRPVGWKPDGH